MISKSNTSLSEIKNQVVHATCQLHVAYAVGLIFEELGMKTGKESTLELIARLEATEGTHDLLDANHRNLIGQMLTEMFEPLGGKRFVILSIPDGNEMAPTVVPFQGGDEPLISIEELKGIFKYLATTEPGDVMDL